MSFYSRNYVKNMWPSAIVHGVARKVYHVKDAKVYDYVKKKDVDMYNSTRIAVVLAGGFSNIWLWPVNLMKDIHEIEAYTRGDAPSFLRDATFKTVEDYFIA